MLRTVALPSSMITPDFTPRGVVSISHFDDAPNATASLFPSLKPLASSKFGPHFAPGPYDVICARGKEAFGHSGNKFFRSLVEKQVDLYADTTSKAQRSSIVSDIIDKVRSMGNGFVTRESDGTWIEVDDTLAREKTGQLFRSALGFKYKSSVASKRRKRQGTSSSIFHQTLDEIMNSNVTVQKTTKAMAKYTRRTSNDEKITAVFSCYNMFLLEKVIKKDKTLVDRFQKAFKALKKDEDDESEIMKTSSVALKVL